MFRQLILLAFAVVISSSACFADALQDTCDTGIPDTIIVGSVHVPGPLWPDSIGVPIYIWADEPIAAFSWGLRPLDNRIRVSSFSSAGSVFPTNMFIPTLVDTVNNQIGFGWADFTGFNPKDSPQGLVGLVYVKVASNMSVGETVTIDSVSINQTHKCSVTSKNIGASCQMRYIGFDQTNGYALHFGNVTENVALDFKFDEPTGRILYDYSGYKVDGVASTGIVRIPGVAGSAYRLSESDTIRFSTAINNCEPNFSVALWLRPTLPVVSYQEAVHHNGLGIWVVGLDSNSIQVRTLVGWGEYWWTQRWDEVHYPLSQTGDWIHIAFVRSEYARLSVYVNGDSIASISTSNCLWYPQTPSLIGGGFNGCVDELRVFRYALTSQEILAEYLRVGYVACGDVDASRQINISDAVFLINYIFASGSEPPKPSAADVSCDGRIDITDAVYLINYFFAGGSVPCSQCN